MELLTNIKQIRSLHQSLLKNLPLMKRKLEAKKSIWPWKKQLSRKNCVFLADFMGFKHLYSKLIEYFRRHPELEESYRRDYTNDIMNKYLMVSSLMSEVERLIVRHILANHPPNR